MSNDKNIPDGKDPQRWNLALKRANFKKQAVSYVVLNAFLWALWYVTGNQYFSVNTHLVPWPVWTTIGLGFGLAYKFAEAYIFQQENATEREYDKLTSNN